MQIWECVAPSNCTHLSTVDSVLAPRRLFSILNQFFRWKYCFIPEHLSKRIPYLLLTQKYVSHQEVISPDYCRLPSLLRLIKSNLHVTWNRNRLYRRWSFNIRYRQFQTCLMSVSWCTNAIQYLEAIPTISQISTQTRNRIYICTQVIAFFKINKIKVNICMA